MAEANKSDKEIMIQFVDTLVKELKAVTGSHFSRTIESNVNEKGFEITADKYIGVLIHGRKPTSASAKTGSPTLQQAILSWINSKSITANADSRGRVPTAEQLSWAISTSIHRHGTKLYQQGGGNNIFDPIINNQRIDVLLSALGQNWLNKIQAINLPEQFIQK